jgi:phage antirepressor YoqD-like protein
MIAFRRIGTIDPEAIRRAAARAWPKGSHGSRPIPRYVVDAMHREYLRVGSLRTAAATFGRTKQDLAWIFRHHGLEIHRRGGRNRMAAKSVVTERYATYRQTGSVREAARRIGCNQTTLLRMLRSHGLPILPSPHRKAVA